MKKEIKKIQDYFKSQLLAKKLDVKEVKDNYIGIEIDGYNFDIYTGGGWRGISTFLNSLILLDFTDKEKVEIFNLLSVPIKKALVYRKLKEIEDLKKEISENQ